MSPHNSVHPYHPIFKSDEHRRICFSFVCVWACGVPAQATAVPMRVRSMPYMISLIISSPGRAAALAFSPHQAKVATSVLLRLHFSLIPSQSSPLSFRTCRPVHHPPLYSTLCSLPLHAPFPSACYFSSGLIITRA